MSDKNETVEQDSTDPRDHEIEKLRAKNKELLAEKQKEKQKAQALADEKDEAEARAAESGGNIDALKAAHAKELQKLQAKLDVAEGDLRTIRVDNEITTAYAKSGRPELAEQFVAWAKTKAQYEDGTATLDGKPLAEAIGEYLGSEVGAHFRRVSDNSGSGAKGNSSTNISNIKLTKRPTTPAEWDILDAMSTAERNAFADSIGDATLKL